MSAPPDFPAVTLWQPWASLVAIGAKPFEFRGWPAPRALWGRRIAIHAGARKVSVKEVRALLVRLHSADWRTTGLLRDQAIAFLDHVKVAPDDLPCRVVVCLATLGQPIRGAEMATALGLPAVNDSERHQHTNYGWPLTDVSRLRPYLPAVGGQGFWRWRPGEPLVLDTPDKGGAA